MTAPDVAAPTSDGSTAVSTAPAIVALPTDPTLRFRDARARWLRPYWAVDAAFALFGLAWVLGLSGVVLPLLAIPLLARLLQTRPIRIPKGMGWYFLFLGWVAASAINLPDASRMIFFGWRFANYISAGIYVLAIYNAPSFKLSTERIVRSVTIMWITVIVGGHLALLLPRFSFTSPTQMVLPGGLASNEVIRRYIHPQLSDVQDFLGFAVPRPSAPFIYTNMWGSNLTLMFPLVLLFVGFVANRRAYLALGAMCLAALPPFVESLNRIAWFSAVLIAVMAVLFARPETRGRALQGMLVGLLVLVMLFAVTSLGTLIGDRIATGHSDNTRADLASQAWEVTNESPLIGYGRPLPNIRYPLRPAIGTQGFFWTLMVAHGYVGLALYAAWVFDALARSWRTRRFPEGKAALMVLILYCVQAPYYDFLPVAVHVMAVAVALERRAAWERRNAAV